MWSTFSLLACQVLKLSTGVHLLFPQVHTPEDISTTSDDRTMLGLVTYIACGQSISVWHKNIPALTQVILYMLGVIVSTSILMAVFQMSNWSVHILWHLLRCFPCFGMCFKLQVICVPLLCSKTVHTSVGIKPKPAAR